MIKRYKLDAKKPPRLTAAEARRLDETPIDYSDIPPLGDELFAKATAALRSAIDEGDASGVAEGDVFARVRSTLKLPKTPRSRPV